MEAGQFLHEQFEQAVAAWKEAAARVPVDPLAIARALHNVSEAKKALDTYHFYLKYMPLAGHIFHLMTMYPIIWLAMSYQIDQKPPK